MAHVHRTDATVEADKWLTRPAFPNRGVATPSGVARHYDTPVVIDFCYLHSGEGGTEKHSFLSLALSHETADSCAVHL